MPVRERPSADSDRPDDELASEYQTWKADQREEVKALAHDFKSDLDVQRAEVHHTHDGPALQVTVGSESDLTANDLVKYAAESPLEETERFAGPSGSVWVTFY